MKFRITLFATISGILIPLNSAHAFSEAEYQYGFSWGSLNAICAAYSLNAISDKNAGMMMNLIIEMGNEDIKDSKLKNKFNNLVKTDNGLKEMGCSKLIK